MTPRAGKVSKKLKDMKLPEGLFPTGTPRPYVYCKTCKQGYLDFCPLLHIDWELRYD